MGRTKLTPLPHAPVFDTIGLEGSHASFSLSGDQLRALFDQCLESLPRDEMDYQEPMGGGASEAARFQALLTARATPGARHHRPLEVGRSRARAKPTISLVCLIPSSGARVSPRRVGLHHC